MRYAVIPFLFLVSVYPFSYSVFNWKRENRLGAVGAALLGLLVIAYPTFILLTR